ncbi:hypothetical protein [Piscirickettsia salmonis]|uniref:hypothetical protein n=1 Tax=Piscirickettsia salmonis TaxID=1238 RepID=UPI0018AD03CD|nr:hypothetical protein [Piscirickettsia salmonis]
MVIQRQKDKTYQIQFTLKHVLQYRSAWWNYRAKHADSIRPAVDENVLKVLGCRTKNRLAAGADILFFNIT